MQAATSAASFPARDRGMTLTARRDWCGTCAGVREQAAVGVPRGLRTQDVHAGREPRGLLPNAAHERRRAHSQTALRVRLAARVKREAPLPLNKLFRARHRARGAGTRASGATGHWNRILEPPICDIEDFYSAPESEGHARANQRLISGRLRLQNLARTRRDSSTASAAAKCRTRTTSRASADGSACAACGASRALPS
ncbi:hypothetical protein B0H15DRAFT_444011 [Mycena belliarum]|uniref:Uncharacterized protein n=1 Tax=Mycena belliarum TaxID=1033014 RepID=A0AAD6XMS9_9AGAR|nr:hypothetical protein B0H15DRAFT_444011 [Mycena belliae]